MRFSIHSIVALTVLLLLSLSAYAVGPDERLADPELEAQAREISKELRCLVCQNQSIDDSDADLAKDLRVLVRKKLVEGNSPDEVIEHVTNIYGDYVLLKPRWTTHTILLWLSPLLLLVGGMTLVRRLFLARPAVTSDDGIPSTGLTSEQVEALKALRSED